MHIQVLCSIINNQHTNGSFIKSNSIRWLVRTHWIVHDNLSTLIKAVHWYGQDNDPSQKFKTNNARIDKHWSLIRIIMPDEIPLSRIPLQIISVLPFKNLKYLDDWYGSCIKVQCKVVKNTNSLLSVNSVVNRTTCFGLLRGHHHVQ